MEEYICYKHHLYRICVKDNQKCDYCDTNNIENVIHYFLKCPAFATERSTLIECVTEIMHFNPFIIEKDKKLCEMILFGFHEITHWKMAELLYTAVTNYVSSTKHFSELLKPTDSV